MSKITTIVALQQSLLELSKSDTTHIDATANQIASTRIALLQMEGVDIEKIYDLEITYKTWLKYDKAIKDFQARLAELSHILDSTTEKLRLKEAELEELEKTIKEKELKLIAND